MSHAGAGADADDGRGTSPLRWLALGLAATAIFSSYYESDAIGPIADKLERAGYPRLTKARRFVVKGKYGPLSDGELERARRWGAELAQAMG